MTARSLLALALTAFALPVAAQVTEFQVETHLVTLTFTVRDARGNLVPGLSPGDFTIHEDGVPQKISFFSRETHLPLTLGLLIDASSSQDKFIHQHFDNVRTFLSRVLEPQDQAFALCFGDHLRIASDFTSSPAAILSGIERYNKDPRQFPEIDTDKTRDGGTALYDAVYGAVSEKLAVGPGRRKAVILFTDGEENSSAHDEIDAIAAAQDHDTLLYAIRYTEVHHNQLTAQDRQGITALHHMTEQTGGADFDALHSDLTEDFTQISNELRSLYSIGYYSTNKRHDGTFRKVVVETHTPGLVVRAKSGYYAR